MDLTNQSKIQIQNKIFTLGSPVTHADTLDQLLYVFQQMGVTERPIVIINPVGDALPDLANLLENYIENAMQGAYTTQRTTYLFQDYTDEQIVDWANTQYQSGGASLDYWIETGKAIREQSRLKIELDKANARRDELWKQHCLHPESGEGSEEYSYITYTVIPQIEASIKNVTDAMGKIPKDLNNGSEPVKQEIVKNPVENVENHVDSPSVGVENPVENVDTTLEMSGTGKPDIMMSSPSRLIMPLSIAKQLADKPENQAFKKQQQQEVPGYVTVPIEYLIALGIKMYADGVPVVYTKSGKFRRVGAARVSPIVSSYWYPTPRYK